jgi:hypothetical protein
MEQQEKKQMSLENFQSKMAELKKEEEINQKTAHFPDLNPAELKEEDRDIYEKYISNNLTEEELDEYRDKLYSEAAINSRIKFCYYIINLFTMKKLDKFIEEDTNKK